MTEYVIAKYIRLSVDDGVTESLSIPHQHLLLNSHIEEMDLHNATVLDFVDNGFTGTNMERPALQEMLEMVRSGRINCIVIKDFSRFSRNALESGYYIEQVFPLYRIRFISVSDGFDSNDYVDDTGGLEVAFKFIMHEYYVQDLSKKVKSGKRIKMLRGENIVADAVYGYRKNAEGRWEPDEIAADVVRKIFSMLMDGLPPAIIKDRLFEAKHPTPNEHIEMKRGKDIQPKCLWTARMIRHILTNEQYIGSYVSGKQQSKAIGSSSKILTARSEWIVIPDSHPAIVSKEDFQLVQHILENRLKNTRVAKPINSWQSDEIKCAKRLRVLNGESIAGTPIYGYSKIEGGKWEIDKPAAAVVRKIYCLALEGLSYYEISEAITEAGHPIPKDYISMARGRNVTPSTKWTTKSVRTILKNEQYTGAYVSGKELKNYATGKNYRTSKNDWVVIPNRHPAIISKEDFDKVQGIIAAAGRRRKNMRPRDYLLRGKIKCGICGYAMFYDPIDEPVFRCYHTDADPTSLCHKMKIVAQELDEVVLGTIKAQAEVVLDAGELSKLKKFKGGIQQIADCENQISKMVEQRQRHYEQFVTGELDSETFQKLKTDCTTRHDMLKQQLALYKQAERDNETGREMTALAKTTLSDSITSKEVVDMLINKVHVFPDCEIEIEWKVSDFAAIVPGHLLAVAG